MLYQVKKLKVYYKAVYHTLKTCYLGKKKCIFAQKSLGKVTQTHKKSLEKVARIGKKSLGKVTQTKVNHS